MHNSFRIFLNKFINLSKVNRNYLYFFKKINLLAKFKFVEFFHKIKTKPVSEVSIRLNKKIDPSPDNFLEKLASNSTSNPFTKWWHYFEIYNEEMKTIAQASREGNLKKPI